MYPISILLIVPFFLQSKAFLTRWSLISRTKIIYSPFRLSDSEWFEVNSPELVTDEEEEDWTPDREKARQARENARIFAEKVKDGESSDVDNNQSDQNPLRPSPYTEEEEEVIASMGGKTQSQQSKRAIGYLGDSTLSEIATDYSVPVCYLADVLCMWGVPVPINVDDRLGDLVTGEQAFAILEAVNSLDIGALHDRYSNTNLLNLCAEWDIDLQEAFELVMKEGWSLPFGVQTCLRVEQEDELLRLLGKM